MDRKNELRKSRIQRWLLVIAGVASIGGVALSEPLAQQPSSPPQVALASPKVPATTPPRATLQPQATNLLPIVQSYWKLPLSFERNDGQTDSQVKFLSRGRGYTLFLTPTEAVLALRHKDPLAPSAGERARVRGNSQSSPRPTEGEGQGEGAILRMHLLGANAQSKVTGLDKLPGIVNYFMGSDPKKWRTSIPTYKKVEYQNIYPGIDLAYYGNQGKLEYDLVVAPGADPSQIKLAFEGAIDIRLAESGDLILTTDTGDVRLQKPLVYQVGADGHRNLIAGSYVVFLNTRHASPVTRHVGFDVASYDHSKPIVIDPVLFYSTYLGGSADDRGEGIAVDAAGNAYVKESISSSTGWTFPIPTGPGAQGNYGGGTSDAFVMKLNATGTAIMYATYLGGSSNDGGNGIAVDAAGNAYVTGFTDSTNFPTANPVQAANGGGDDAFVTKPGTSGGLGDSTYLGGSSNDEGRGIAVDAAGNAYVAGSNGSTNFPTASPLQAANGGSSDAFVTKLNAAGSALLYSTYLGGSASDSGQGIAVDAAGNAYVTGSTSSTNFPTQNPTQATNGTGSDAFIAELNASGSSLLYSTFLGGSSFE